MKRVGARSWILCRAFLPLLTVLGVAWDEATCRRGTSACGEDAEDGHKFNPKDATKVINDKMFGAYLHLVIWLGDIQQEAAKWTEGCACHGDLLIGTRKDRRANIMRKRFKHDIGNC